MRVGHMEMATTREGWITMVCSNLEFDRLARLGTVVKKTRKIDIQKQLRKIDIEIFGPSDRLCRIMRKEWSVFYEI